jgi:predicted ribosome quality control (RQC) complex YloA/Tae2 family protein
MEGLLINAIIRQLRPTQTLGWAFPNEGTAAILLEGLGNLVLHYRPPNPLLELQPGRLEGQAKTPFQRMLEARARGPLEKIEQLKLDRVVKIYLGGEKGFIDTAPTVLVFELTGRNANLILCTENQILGIDRAITPQINRFRELRPGLAYVPPPPYSKLDPRNATVSDLAVLVGKNPAQIGQYLDGLGKEMALELASRSSLSGVIQPEHLPSLAEALKQLVANPTPTTPRIQPDYAQQEAESLRKPLREALRKQASSLEARLQSTNAALNLEDVPRLRGWGDLLMAYGSQVTGPIAQLTDFDGKPVEIPIEPGLSAIKTAEKLYARAKRLEHSAEKALELQPQITLELSRVLEEIAGLETLSKAELTQRKTREKVVVGLRTQSPSGFGIWVGRNNKENDYLTRAAHSEDLWFHVQGIPGAHVILRTQGQSAPLPDLLFAAQLAAYYSKAKGDKNVAVDYTTKKYVWRPRKAAAGQVLYTQGKTLFVDAQKP